MSDQPSGVGGIWELVLSNGAPSTDRSSTVAVSGASAGEILLFQPGQANSTTLPALPSAFSAQAWRLKDPLSGLIPAGTWTLDLEAYNPGGVLLSGRFWARLWKGSAADGSDASPLGSWTAGNTALLSLLALTPINDQVSFVMASAEPMHGHYLFVELAWEIGALNVLPGLVVALTCDQASGQALALPGLASFTPSPTATATVTGTASATPSPSSSATPSATASVTATASPSATPTASPGPASTATATPGGSPMPSPPPQGFHAGGLAAGQLRTDNNAFDPAQGPLLISGALDAPGHVYVDIYDAAGRRVRSVLDEDRPAGRWDARWDGTDEAGRARGSDLYLIVLRQPSVTRVFKTALVRD